MVIYFILGLFTGWLTIILAFAYLTIKLDQKNKELQTDLISYLKTIYDQDIQIENYRKYKS
jgi:hypothetical protein|tara:strand:+ start:660 stop:842 length:183 start_codon:yes stop_codon:yes gene_type:complete